MTFDRTARLVWLSVIGFAAVACGSSSPSSNRGTGGQLVPGSGSGGGQAGTPGAPAPTATGGAPLPGDVGGRGGTGETAGASIDAAAEVPSGSGGTSGYDGATAPADAAHAGTGGSGTGVDAGSPVADAAPAASDGPSGSADGSGTAPPSSDGYRLFPQANSTSSYAISMAAELWSWGANGSGQLGHAGAMTAAQVMALGMNAVSYAGGEIHAVAVARDGTAFTFGTNFSGQLGNTIDTGTFTNPHPNPAMVALPAGVKAVPSGAAGERYSAVIGDDGNVYIWGGNLYGQQANRTNIGNMTANPAVHAVPKPTGVTTWKSLGGGYSHLLAIAQDDQMWSWGDNRQGQLGVGMMASAPDGVVKAVTKPAGVTGWTFATGGRDFSLALAIGGALYAWGANDMGQLAMAGGSQSTPTMINLPAGATGWRKVAAGKDHAVAITAEGKLYAWGNGSGATLKEVAPPAGVANWTDVSAGVGLVIGAGADGKVYQWNAGAKPAAPMAGLP